MTAAVAMKWQRRGACPGLSAPMPTGDGLLVRLLPVGTIPLAAFGKLLAAARACGNGIVEVTSRGSLQIRGLGATTALRFADAVAMLGIAGETGIPVHTGPLSGLDPGEIFQTDTLAATMRRALAKQAFAKKLSAKVSVAIDGGGALDLERLSADVRLRADRIEDDVALRIAVGAEGADAVEIGLLAPADAVDAIARLLKVIAQHGEHARARDVVAAEGIEPFQTALEDLSFSRKLPMPSVNATRSDPIGLHRLRDRTLACGIGLAFGHADARSLERLVEAADLRGAIGIRTAPDRALLAIGLTADAVSAFSAAAGRLGFIVRADDPRKRVIACAGAPVCASAHIASRALAPAIAEQAATVVSWSGTIHISGCAKGCAHPARSALTIVGRPEGCGLVAGGTARDQPHAIVTIGDLLEAAAKSLRTQEARHG